MTPPLVLAAGDLRIKLFREHDRFAHTICIERGGRLLRLLASAEGTPQDAWPPSPPLQEMHVEERSAGRRVALLVGMAGRSHWSASIEVDPALGRATFDLACRTTEAVAPVGSRYRIEAAVRVARPAGAAERTLDLAGNFEPLVAGEHSDPDASARLELDCAPPGGTAELCHAGEWLTIEPACSAAAGARTVRWKYAIFRLNPAGAAARFGP